MSVNIGPLAGTARLYSRGLAVIAATAAIGCGRLGFESGADGGGTSDAARDAASDAASGPCTERYADVIVCDDFDDPTFPGWTVQQGGGSITSVVRDGQRGVRFDVPANGGSVELVRSLTPALIDGQVYMRIRARAPVFANANFVILAQLTSTSKVSIDLESNDRLQIFTPGDFDGGATGSFLRDTYQCIELEVGLAPLGGAGYGRLFRDGTLVAMVPTGTETVVPGGYSTLRFGASSATGNVAVELELDDLVVARAPVGCD